MSDQEKQTEQETNTTPESLRILEAVLFASEDVLSVAKLKEILPDVPDARVIRRMVDEINIHMQRERHPFEIVELGGGYQFRTIPYYQPWVQQLFKEKATKKVSIQGLECLAIIAYKQPISKTEIESIRGVLSEGAMKTLLERRLITISGRSDGPGRPLLYSTTPVFLTYFGINKLSDLPRIEEFEAMAREKMEEVSQEELEGLGLPFEAVESREEVQSQEAVESQKAKGDGLEEIEGQKEVESLKGAEGPENEKAETQNEEDGASKNPAS